MINNAAVSLSRVAKIHKISSSRIARCYICNDVSSKKQDKDILILGDLLSINIKIS